MGNKLAKLELKPSKPVGTHEVDQIWQLYDPKGKGFLTQDEARKVSETFSIDLVDGERAKIYPTQFLKDFSEIAGVPFDAEKADELIKLWGESTRYYSSLLMISFHGFRLFKKSLFFFLVSSKEI